MNINRVCLFYYSPTGTTEKVIINIGKGICNEPMHVISNCLTYPEYSNSVVDVQPDDLVVIAAPVYVGRIAKTAIERLNTIKFAGNKAVFVAVYGNRDYEDALIEFREWAKETGLLPIAFAAFIGEHSYSTKRDPIGHGRPDNLDKSKAFEFGQLIATKLQNLEPAAKIEIPEIPGTFPLPERRELPPIFASTVQERCVKCGVCQSVCPTGAIYFKRKYFTNSELCTLCCACVRSCKQSARVIDSDHLRKIREWLLSTCQERREPETFI